MICDHGGASGGAPIVRSRKNPYGLTAVYGTNPAGRFAAGKVIHSAGWPAPSSLYAGAWIYGMKDHRVSIGYVTALDARQPWHDPWEMFQRWKTHPMVRELLAGGELLKSGAKTVPEGGYWSRPKSAGAGFLIVGDSGSLLNISRLRRFLGINIPFQVASIG